MFAAERGLERDRLCQKMIEKCDLSAHLREFLRALCG